MALRTVALIAVPLQPRNRNCASSLFSMTDDNPVPAYLLKLGNLVIANHINFSRENNT